jgi:hypothetical protein
MTEDAYILFDCRKAQGHVWRRETDPLERELESLKWAGIALKNCGQSYLFLQCLGPLFPLPCTRTFWRLWNFGLHAIAIPLVKHENKTAYPKK